MMKKGIILVLISICLLVSGCGGSSDNKTSTKPITITLSNKYTTTDNQSQTLPAGKSCVFIVSGHKQQTEPAVFQEFFFSQTGADQTFNIPNLPEVNWLQIITEISLDETFNDRVSWSYLKRTNIVFGVVLKTDNNGNQTSFIDANTTNFTINNLRLIKNTTYTANISQMIQRFSRQFNMAINANLK